MDIPTAHFVFATGASFLFGAIATLLIIRLFAVSTVSVPSTKGKERKKEREMKEESFQDLADLALKDLQSVESLLKTRSEKYKDAISEKNLGYVQKAINELEQTPMKYGYDEKTHTNYTIDTYKKVTEMVILLYNVMNMPYNEDFSKALNSLISIKNILKAYKK